MSDEIAIQVRGLGKKYTIGGPQEEYHTIRDAITNSVKAPFRKLTHTDTYESGNEFWALKEVSFEIKKGEVMGIIGRNGAGKSTLLKILSRITMPTEGEVDIYGRVGSLLEVGTGFHPELTGRENIFLSGSILGMRKREIEEKFDEIVKFSEIEKFIDTPVKRYSSGMYVRLGFAVAAHLDPDILVIDEVLAVGDSAFQKKCLGKMEEVSQEGRTVLFVSHNMGAVRRLCQKGVVINQGKITFQGSATDAVENYMKSISGNDICNVSFPENIKNAITILEAAIFSPELGNCISFDLSDMIGIELCYKVREDIKGTNIQISIERDNITVFRSWDIDLNPSAFELRKMGTYIAKIVLPKNLLAIGKYQVSILSGRPGVTVIENHYQCLSFDVANIKEDRHISSYSRSGTLIVMPLDWEITQRT
jgi:lipopolysaccharide transport system ATP-binding protein